MTASRHGTASHPCALTSDNAYPDQGAEPQAPDPLRLHSSPMFVGLWPRRLSSLPATPFGRERFGPILDQIYIGPFLEPLKVRSWGIVVHNPQFMGFRRKILNCLNTYPQQFHGCMVRLMGYHDDARGLDGSTTLRSTSTEIRRGRLLEFAGPLFAQGQPIRSSPQLLFRLAPEPRPAVTSALHQAIPGDFKCSVHHLSETAVEYSSRYWRQFGTWSRTEKAPNGMDPPRSRARRWPITAKLTIPAIRSASLRRSPLGLQNAPRRRHSSNGSPDTTAQNECAELFCFRASAFFRDVPLAQDSSGIQNPERGTWALPKAD